MFFHSSHSLDLFVKVFQKFEPIRLLPGGITLVPLDASTFSSVGMICSCMVRILFQRALPLEVSFLLSFRSCIHFLWTFKIRSFKLESSNLTSLWALTSKFSVFPLQQPHIFAPCLVSTFPPVDQRTRAQVAVCLAFGEVSLSKSQGKIVSEILVLGETSSKVRCLKTLLLFLPCHSVTSFTHLRKLSRQSGGVCPPKDSLSTAVFSSLSRHSASGHRWCAAAACAFCVHTSSAAALHLAGLVLVNDVLLGSPVSQSLRKPVFVPDLRSPQRIRSGNCILWFDEWASQSSQTSSQLFLGWNPGPFCCCFSFYKIFDVFYSC